MSFIVMALKQDLVGQYPRTSVQKNTKQIIIQEMPKNNIIMHSSLKFHNTQMQKRFMNLWKLEYHFSL